MKHFLFIIIILISTFQLFAQANREKALYDSITYHYYQNAQWDSVIDVGKEAIYKGYDFYYLRMRMGLAYDNHSNFRLAERQYAKALEFVPTDANAAYYQYYASLNGGRQDVAYESYKNFTDNQKDLIRGKNKKDKNLKLPVKLKAIEQISFYSGYSLTGNKNKSADILPLYRDVLMSQTNIRNTQFYTSLNLKGNISENLTWNAAYNYNLINGKYLLRPQNEDLQTHDSKIQQNEFFGKLIYWTGSGLSFEGFGQVLSYKSDSFHTTVESINYLPPEINDTILIAIPNLSTTAFSISNNDWVAGLKIKKTISLLDLSLFGTYSKIANLQSWQMGGAFTILPNGNYGLYLTNRIVYYSDSISDRFIYKVIAGGQIAKKLQIMAAATFGNLQFTNEADYGLTYNWSEETSFKADIGLSYPLSDKVYLSLNYQLTQKKAKLSLLQIRDFEENAQGHYLPIYGEAFDKYQFNQHFIFLGLTWYL